MIGEVTMTPEQVELIVRKAVAGEAQDLLLLSIVLIGVVTLAAAYFGTYFQSKGGYRALREELDTLTKQVSATTRAAEEIKARIGQSTWVEQRRWELKRELYTDLLKAIYRAYVVSDRIMDLYVVEDTMEPGKYRDDQIAMRERLERELPPLWDEVARVQGIGEVVFNADTIAALDRLQKARVYPADSYFEHIDQVAGASRTAHEALVKSAKQDLEL